MGWNRTAESSAVRDLNRVSASPIPQGINLPGERDSPLDSRGEEPDVRRRFAQAWLAV